MGYTPNDVVFSRQVLLDDLVDEHIVRLDSDILPEATAVIWVRVYPSFPRPAGACGIGSWCRRITWETVIGENLPDQERYYRDPPLGHEDASNLALVGIRVSYGSRIDTVQPIFSRIDGDGNLGSHDIYGDRHGSGVGSSTIILRALPGYAVAGIDVDMASSSGVLTGMRLIYKRWNRGEPLQSGTYFSTAAGLDSGAWPYRTETSTYIVGVHGNADTESNRLTSIGIMSAQPGGN